MNAGTSVAGRPACKAAAATVCPRFSVTWEFMILPYIAIATAPPVERRDPASLPALGQYIDLRIQ